MGSQFLEITLRRTGKEDAKINGGSLGAEDSNLSSDHESENQRTVRCGARPRRSGKWKKEHKSTLFAEASAPNVEERKKRLFVTLRGHKQRRPHTNPGLACLGRGQVR